uniref:Uncharacterized protein n=1 Tax=Leersia perrieri TaxID=77586 RepID=A0A0D9VIG7_9ORYZ
MSICARVEPPRGGGALGKRKERERSSAEQPRAPPPLFSASLAAKSQPPRPANPNRFVKPMPPPPPFAKGGGSSGGFKLMAGYLAHEFLKSGTLLGERPESTSGKAPTAATAVPGPDPRAQYAEASLLLMAGGARVPGVVNPTQLGHWLRIKE